MTYTSRERGGGGISMYCHGLCIVTVHVDDVLISGAPKHTLQRKGEATVHEQIQDGGSGRCTTGTGHESDTGPKN